MDINKVIIVNTLDCYKCFVYNKIGFFTITEYYNDAYNLKDVKDFYIKDCYVNKNNIKYTDNKVIINMLNNLPYSDFGTTLLNKNDKIKFELIFNLIK